MANVVRIYQESIHISDKLSYSTTFTKCSWCGNTFALVSSWADLTTEIQIPAPSANYHRRFAFTHNIALVERHRLPYCMFTAYLIHCCYHAASCPRHFVIIVVRTTPPPLRVTIHSSHPTFICGIGAQVRHLVLRQHLRPLAFLKLQVRGMDGRPSVPEFISHASPRPH